MVAQFGYAPNPLVLQTSASTKLAFEPWWRLQGTILQPTACKAVALPIELSPRGAPRELRYPNLLLVRQMLSR